MENVRVKLVFPDAKISDLGKLPAAIGGVIPGATTLINVVEKYYKKFAGGLPVDCKLTFGSKGLIFEANFWTKLMTEGIEKVEIPYVEIKSVSCEVDRLHSIMTAYNIVKSKVVTVNTDHGAFKILDVPDIMSLYKSKAEKIKLEIEARIKK